MAYWTINDPPFAGLTGREPEALFRTIPTPCYVMDEARLRANAQCLGALAGRTRCRVLLAQKAFSNYDFYPLLADHLAGTEASGLYEARLGREQMPGREVHVFCGAYRDDEFDELLAYADHIVFNSIHQLKKFGPKGKACGKSLGLRINPECSTQEGHAIYDPCAPGSRMGVTRAVWDREMDEETLSLLEGCIRRAQQQWGVTVYLEPGEAVALNAGYLVSRVLDIVENGDTRIAILDASAACHMPDVLEMPYQPPIYQASVENEAGDRYRLAGPTCLAGDVIGDYTFARSLQEGDLVLFGDMAIYTTCKNNTFNGMPLPNIWKLDEEGKLTRLTNFGYETFRERLGRQNRDCQ